MNEKMCQVLEGIINEICEVAKAIVKAFDPLFEAFRELGRLMAECLQGRYLKSTTRKSDRDFRIQTRDQILHDIKRIRAQEQAVKQRRRQFVTRRRS